LRAPNLIEGGGKVGGFLKIGGGISALAVAIAVGLALSRGLAAAPAAHPRTAVATPVTAAQVEQHDVPIEVEGLGTVQALYTATIRTQVQGTIESVGFVEGQEVKRGQTLAQIDPRLYQAQFDAATATLGRDQAHLENAKANLNRDLPLLSRGFATPQQVDNQKAQVAQLENTVKSDQATLESARTQLSYATITAPFDGITGIRLVDPGNVVHPTDQNGLVVMTQVQPISVVFTLPSAAIP
jgi:membrane fusion protein, multidrug efflux system